MSIVDGSLVVKFVITKFGSNVVVVGIATVAVVIPGFGDIVEVAVVDVCTSVGVVIGTTLFVVDDDDVVVNIGCTVVCSGSIDGMLLGTFVVDIPWSWFMVSVVEEDNAGIMFGILGILGRLKGNVNRPGVAVVDSPVVRELSPSVVVVGWVLAMGVCGDEPSV